MDTKKIIWILIGVTFIAFGIGFFSLKNNEGVNFSNMRGGIFNISSNEAEVNIGNGKIDIKDGNTHVKVGWDGINVKDGDDHVVVDWEGVKVKEGNRSFFNFFSKNNWFTNYPRKTNYLTIDEEKLLDIDEIEEINISSGFIDIKAISEDRNDIFIKYHGNMESDVLPELDIVQSGNSAFINLKTPNSGYTVVNSNVILEIFIPRIYNKDIVITNASGDIYLKNLNLGEVFLSTSSGDIDVEDVQANKVNSKTSSGDIEIEDYTGDLGITSISGDIILDIIDETKNIDLSTSSGDISLILPSDSNYTIDGSTSSGEFKSNIPIKIVRNENKIFKAILGKGEKSIKISTTSGDVVFHIK